MLSTPAKVILLLVAMVALEVTLVSGLKCYGCYPKDDGIEDCRTPNATTIKTLDPNSTGALHCSVDIIYTNKTNKHTIEVFREFINLAQSDMAGLAKHGEKVMASCDDFTKFPEPVQDEASVGEYLQTCYCTKDMCNSAIIPETIKF